MAGEVKDVRKKGLLYVLIVFGVCTAWFFSRQNYAGQIGGQISIVKTLWLYYAISAWIIIPIFYFHSNKTNLILSRIYKFHLISFTIRALVELWMLYVTISWIPPYGIAHDVFAISLIAFSLWYFREKLHLIADKGNVSAKRFLYSIQIGLCIEIVFAWLFYRVTGGQVGIYFASSHSSFSFINTITFFVVIAAYVDLIFILWNSRDILFPFVKNQNDLEMSYAQ